MTMLETDINYDDRKKFLDELTALSKKYNLIIENKCCHESPWILNPGEDISQDRGYVGCIGFIWRKRIK